jgi:hypothetical protein
MSYIPASPILFESVSAVTATPSVDIGTERVVDGERYVYVYNCSGSTISAGKGVSRPVSAAGGLYSVAVGSALGDVPVGWIKHADVPTLNYAWALKRGRVNVAVASSASDQSAGPKAMGAAGIVSTYAAGLYPIGELNTLIVSGNSGYLYLNLP